MSDAVAVSQKLFVRRMEIPPAAPWVQAQAAQMDARHGAPLGGGALTWSIRRLGRWRPGVTGEFAVAYARAADVTSSRAEAEVGGRPVTITFTRVGAAGRGAALAVKAAMIAAPVAALLLAGDRALDIRHQREASLGRLEEIAFRWQRHDRAERRAEAQARQLSDAGLVNRSFADLGADLYWLAQAKSPEARIDQVAWRPGELVVHSSGSAAPVAGRERSVERQEDSAGGGWRIASAPPPVVRGGQVRPSVVTERRPSVKGTQP